jgi:hypothetical protein
MPAIEIFQWIENTTSSTALRESIWVFPVVETLHVLGLAFSVGTVMWLDLRLMGVSMRNYTVTETFQFVKPWMVAGFALMMVTGVLLFWAHALRCYESVYFRIKIVLLVLAGLNLAVFHRAIDRRRAVWDAWPEPPIQARLAGLASLLLWLGIVAAGRLMAYTL